MLAARIPQQNTSNHITRIGWILKQKKENKNQKIQNYTQYTWFNFRQLRLFLRTSSRSTMEKYSNRKKNLLILPVWVRAGPGLCTSPIQRNLNVVGVSRWSKKNEQNRRKAKTLDGPNTEGKNSAARRQEGNGRPRTGGTAAASEAGAVKEGGNGIPEPKKFG